MELYLIQKGLSKSSQILSNSTIVKDRKTQPVFDKRKAAFGYKRIHKQMVKLKFPRREKRCVKPTGLDSGFPKT
jgi:hypothetical protein